MSKKKEYFWGVEDSAGKEHEIYLDLYPELGDWVKFGREHKDGFEVIQGFFRPISVIRKFWYV